MPGGVCSVLTYEVDQMAEYVAEMSTRIIMPRSLVNPAFRKYVTQILTSTRLPSTTILLGMNYLAKRMNMINANGVGETKATDGHVWRMLTTALLLGSKFLDDNTFQNKSWSEVSGLSVTELNKMENDWLREINWCLYVNLDESKDYKAWLKNWDDWLDSKKQQQAQAARERLSALVTPIDTSIAPTRNPNIYSPWHQQSVADYDRLSAAKRTQQSLDQGYHSRAQRDVWGYQPAAWAPLTPPDSGYGTPEYSNSAASATSPSQYELLNQALIYSANAQRHFSRQAPQHQHHQTQQGYQATFAPSARHSQAYPSYYPFSHSIWESSTTDCPCQSCVSSGHGKNHAYLGSHSFGQSVMG